MTVRILSASLVGLEASPVEVEVDLSSGPPVFKAVGLVDRTVREAEERVKFAIRNSSYRLPDCRITVNLAPADIRKEGAAFDLPIALGIMAATGELKCEHISDCLILGELSLDGKVKGIKGALPIALLARDRNFSRLLLPGENVAETAVVGAGVRILGVGNLREATEFLEGIRAIDSPAIDPTKMLSATSRYDRDFADVKGQAIAKRALEVAAAGGHNVLMIGPPGAGKTMLAKRVPTILPPLTFEEAMETTKVYSVAGLLNGRALIGTRPFRAPHHTISDAGLLGGGPVPQPGEMSLADNGVLFLDELPEFRKNVIEVLRQPLEDRRITLTRVTGSLTFPTNVMLIGAMNGCACGFQGDPKHECICTPPLIRRYRSRISGPLLDRIDIQIEVPSVKYEDIAESTHEETSEAIRARVIQARALQLERFRSRAFFCNASMTSRDIRTFCQIERSGERLLELAINQLGLSGRAYNRILKVARTIADLDGGGPIEAHHVSEAIQYRSLDRSV